MSCSLCQIYTLQALIWFLMLYKLQSMLGLKSITTLEKALV